MNTCLPLLSSALTFAWQLGAQTPIVGIWRLDEMTGLVATDSGPSGNNGGGLFTIGSGRTSKGTTDKLQIYIRSSQPVVVVQEAYSVAPVFDDQWHHVVYVDNAGDAALYVDGVLDAGSFDYRNNTNGTQTANYGEFGVGCSNSTLDLVQGTAEFSDVVIATFGN